MILWNGRAGSTVQMAYSYYFIFPFEALWPAGLGLVLEGEFDSFTTTADRMSHMVSFWVANVIQFYEACQFNSCDAHLCLESCGLKLHSKCRECNPINLPCDITLHWVKLAAPNGWNNCLILSHREHGREKFGSFVSPDTHKKDWTYPATIMHLLCNVCVSCQ